MSRKRSLRAVIAASFILTACGNTVYGPRRLIQAGYIDDGGAAPRRHCPATVPSVPDSTPIDMTIDFYDRACASLREWTNPSAARLMLDSGITLNRMRCNDFFAERAGNQMRERILRGAVVPVSALITGIIGIANFSTDAARQEAIQILGIGQSATIAGLELYESEFLFGASNINSVRALTMRALDEHAAGVLTANVGFYGAARHIIDHQMVCTPANILELTQTAIREGRITPSRTPGESRRSIDGGGDQTTIAMIAVGLHTSDLTADQLGSLWLLSNLVIRGTTPSQDILAVLQSRLSALRLNPISGPSGSLVVDQSLVRQFTPLLDMLSPAVTSGFAVTQRLLELGIAEGGTRTVLQRTNEIRFDLPPSAIPPAPRAVEVGVPSVSEPSQ